MTQTGEKRTSSSGTNSNSLLKTVLLKGPIGRLEALLNAGTANATHAALVCHPHPLFGGTMHNKVVYNTMKALNGFGFPVLRFNFRGVGGSQGEHDNGRGEVDDVRAALNWLQTEFQLPIISSGFSFGAAMNLRAGCAYESVVGLVSLGTPVRFSEGSYDYEFLQSCTKRKLFVSGDRDEFGGEELERVIAAAAEPKRLVIVQGADHFFEGKLKEERRAIEQWIVDEFPRNSSFGS